MISAKPDHARQYGYARLGGSNDWESEKITDEKQHLLP
jgi:hypothetical protein